MTLTSAATLRRFRRGSSLIEATGSERWAAVVLSGRVRILDAREGLTIATRRAGDIVGEQSMLDGLPRSATVVADTDVRALVLGHSAMEYALNAHPHVLRVLCEVVSERLREADATLSVLRHDSRGKVARLLARLADRNGCASTNGIRVHIGSQAELGEQLALSRESVVRALQELRTKGIVTTRRGTITVHDIVALRAAAG
ncbi:MAG TPA: Crp/Fnr family transcriptional regulator [Pseudonocardiaceae bacterium]